MPSTDTPTMPRWYGEERPYRIKVDMKAGPDDVDGDLVERRLERCRGALGERPIGRMESALDPIPEHRPTQPDIASAFQ
jgi:hypothetical protein